jgi:hypothetical protein
MTENPRTKTDGVVPGQHGFARKCHATERARSGSARSFGRPSLSAMGSPDQGEGRTCSSRDRRSHCRRARQRTRPSCEFGDGCRRRLEGARQTDRYSDPTDRSPQASSRRLKPNQSTWSGISVQDGSTWHHGLADLGNEDTDDALGRRAQEHFGGPCVDDIPGRFRRCNGCVCQGAPPDRSAPVGGRRVIRCLGDFAGV